MRRIDAWLGRWSMYRLVLAVLATLALVSVAAAAAGQIGLDAVGMLASLAVATAATTLGSVIGARLWRATTHLESSLITALILFFLFWPSLAATDLLAVAAAGLIAGLSKFALAWRRRHVLNPAAAGAVVVGVAGLGASTWWVGSTVLVPFVAAGALLVLWRTRRLAFASAYAAPAVVLTALGQMHLGVAASTAFTSALTASPIVFLAGFMLSEPLTQPPRAWQRAVVAPLDALLSVAPLWLTLPVAVTPELALAVANVVAFGFGQRRRVELELVTREMRGGILDLTLRPVGRSGGLRAVPGQYLELDLPHPHTDSRGRRRVLSLASDPASGLVRLMTRIPDLPSTFKRSLTALGTGDRVAATGVGGDFVLPREGARPLALIAGGIGVTPFLAHLDALGARGPRRDVVLVHAVSRAEELVTVADVAGAAAVVAVVPDRPRGLPAEWRWVPGSLTDPEVLARAVPDLAGRDVLVSGPPVMVGEVRSAARRAGARRVRTDAFLGY